MTRQIKGPADLRPHIVMVNDENDRDRMRYENVFTKDEVRQIIELVLTAGFSLGKCEGRGVWVNTAYRAAAKEKFNAWATIARSLADREK